MNQLDHYVLQNIISYCDVDTKFIMRVVNKKLRQYVENIELEKETLDDARVSENLHRFHLGLINNSFRMVRNEIKKGNYNNNLGGNCACHRGNVKMFQFFMDIGFDDYDDLMTSACFGGHFEIVKIILKKYPDYAQIGFSSASGTGHFDIAEFLLQYCKPEFNESIKWSCKYNGVDSIKYLIENGFNDWNYGLTMGCYYECLGVIELMIEKGATSCEQCNAPIEKHLITSLSQRMSEYHYLANENITEYYEGIEWPGEIDH
jgi:hypothetical protein